MSRGVVIFAVNNERVDYGQLAIVCASFVRRNMPGTSIAVITDAGTRAYQATKTGQEFERIFDHVVLMPEREELFLNTRKYRDTQYYGVDERFRNEGRASVYDLTPYDETLLIDSDFLVCNNSLSHVWGNSEEFMINRTATDLMHVPLDGPEFRLNPYGIPMYWATVIYFKKGRKARQIFHLVEHIRENWDFYKHSYDFPGHLFRNDYAFSIAIHMLSGFVEDADLVVALPDNTIYTALDIDQFYGISSPSELHFFMQDRKDTWRYFGVRTKGLNVHCMNKLSLLNNYKEILEVMG